MSTIDTTIIHDLLTTIVNKELNKFDENNNYTEYGKHDLLLPVSQSILSSRPGADQLTNNYLLSNKEVNKIKRLDPSKKIIDAFDIDWSGYSVIFNGETYSPTTTFELLDLIFRILTYLYDLHGNPDVVWNDAGEARHYSNTLDWANKAVTIVTPDNRNEYFDSNSSTKSWEGDEDTTTPT